MKMGRFSLRSVIKVHEGQVDPGQQEGLTERYEWRLFKFWSSYKHISHLHRF